MANVYVRSGAAGTGTGADWTNAYTTLVAAYAAKAAGDDFWVSEDHAESTAGVTLVCPGTPASPCRTVCVNHAGTVPPVSADLRTTAAITSTTSNDLIITGCSYVYGISLTCGSSSNAPDFHIGDTTETDLYFDACKMIQGGTTSGRMLLGGTSNSIGCKVSWNNTTYKVNAAAATIQMRRCDFQWKNTATAVDIGVIAPTNLFGANAVNSGVAVLDGVDLIGLSTKTIVAAIDSDGTYYIKDCKLPASITINATPTSASVRTYVIRSASGATAYTLEAHDIRGDQTTETTIVRTGGTQVNSTSLAMKLVGTASAKFTAPFTSTPLVVTNTTTGANVTVTVYGIWTSGSLPTNKQVWMEVGYLGSASTPQLSFNSGTVADVLATGANQTTDSSVWGGSTTAFKMVTTLTTPQPALAGEMYITIKVATTTAVYIDPTPALS